MKMNQRLWDMSRRGRVGQLWQGRAGATRQRDAAALDGRAGDGQGDDSRAMATGRRLGKATAGRRQGDRRAGRRQEVRAVGYKTTLSTTCMEDERSRREIEE